MGDSFIQDAASVTQPIGGSKVMFSRNAEGVRAHGGEKNQKSSFLELDEGIE
jgi:hypothetical protein